MKETYEIKPGHPADCNHKRTSSGKSRDNKKKRSLQILNKKKDYKNGCLFKINFQYPNHHRNTKDNIPELNWDSKRTIN